MKIIFRRIEKYLCRFKHPVRDNHQLWVTQVGGICARLNFRLMHVDRALVVAFGGEINFGRSEIDDVSRQPLGHFLLASDPSQDVKLSEEATAISAGMKTRRRLKGNSRS